MIILSKTINFFREITKIPRKSGYEEKIVKFLIDFAKMRNLYWEIDKFNNVLIKKKTAKKILQKLSNYCKKFCFILNILDYHPPFHSYLNSKLIKALIKSSPYNTLPQVKNLHITLEVEYFQEKIPNLEIAVISPNIKNAHSTSENIDIKSIAMVDKWLENFLNDF